MAQVEAGECGKEKWKSVETQSGFVFMDVVNVSDSNTVYLNLLIHAQIVREDFQSSTLENEADERKIEVRKLYFRSQVDKTNDKQFESMHWC